ncbi:MAG: glycoside hydrolase family 88 protein [Myxococcota bacterium]|nr:glycoside hydrolase family 88 protein [Myxococcota bacterium]
MSKRAFAGITALSLCSLGVFGNVGGCGGGQMPSTPSSGVNHDAHTVFEGGDAASDGATVVDNGDVGSANSLDSSAANPDVGVPDVSPGVDSSQPATPDGAPTGPSLDGGMVDGTSAGLDPSVLAIMRKVADWQLQQAGINAIDWIHGAMWTGILATYQVTGDVKYRDAAKGWGQNNNWSLTGGVTTNADNQCAAQTYFDLYLLDPIALNMAFITKAKPSFDAMLASGNTGWTWADSLFMSPPGLTRLGAITSDTRYFQLLHTNWWNAYAAMFSPADGLMYRDPPRGAGNGIFWARGNGWVIAGTARVLEYLPKTEPRRPEYVKMLTTMAAALKPWQGADGLWRADITHPAAFANPETSGTGFMTFAMAWGINNAILDRATYLPVVKAGWQGLVGNVDAAGRLGFVQGVGAAPAAATPTSNAPYGVGAFLLAGSEVAKL